ncbi:hypothetical protein AM571_PC01843 (plasmid) [Rhizobium etli 8C-3]|uniref:Uncharacterized protein n=1 Tax=Rhizobium etli 8C-3 TaxID=538025 RepID=A0A1L5PHE8_RHIET|nr:hypothetical protein AM571_PC01843 [Rhizobium etli 8C-3]
MIGSALLAQAVALVWLGDGLARVDNHSSGAEAYLPQRRCQLPGVEEGGTYDRKGLALPNAAAERSRHTFGRQDRRR